MRGFSHQHLFLLFYSSYMVPNFSERGRSAEVARLGITREYEKDLQELGLLNERAELTAKGLHHLNRLCMIKPVDFEPPQDWTTMAHDITPADFDSERPALASDGGWARQEKLMRYTTAKLAREIAGLPIGTPVEVAWLRSTLIAGRGLVHRFVVVESISGRAMLLDHEDLQFFK